jgi:hypothetical protein
MIAAVWRATLGSFSAWFILWGHKCPHHVQTIYAIAAQVHVVAFLASSLAQHHTGQGKGDYKRR